jgi:ParB family chromosome partitioning protein
MIDVSRIIQDTDQPRKEFEADGIARLAASLIKHGQLQPIRVRWDANLKFWVVVHGERRWRAAREAGLERLHCVVDVTDTDSIFQRQLVENCLREDLRPIEQAHAFRRLMDENGWSYAEVAVELNMTKTSVHRAVSLLSLVGEVRDMVEAGTINPTAAAEISRVEPERQVELARAVADEEVKTPKVAERARRLRGRSTPERFEYTTRDGLKVSAPPKMTRERLLAALGEAMAKAGGWESKSG